MNECMDNQAGVERMAKEFTAKEQALHEKAVARAEAAKLKQAMAKEKKAMAQGARRRSRSEAGGGGVGAMGERELIFEDSRGEGGGDAVG